VPLFGGGVGGTGGTASPAAFTPHRRTTNRHSLTLTRPLRPPAAASGCLLADPQMLNLK
jgi:hypothetical protein